MNGEPGRTIRPPLRSFFSSTSHQTYSSQLPAFVAEYVIENSPVSSELHFPSERCAVAVDSFAPERSGRIVMPNTYSCLDPGLHPFEYWSRKLRWISTGTPAGMCFPIPEPVRTVLLRSGILDERRILIGEPWMLWFSTRTCT